MNKPIGLRETIAHTDDPGVVEDCIYAAALCTQMHPKTRRAIHRVAERRLREFSEADGHAKLNRGGK